MPNHEFVPHLRKHAQDLQEELDAVNKLLDRYDDKPEGGGGRDNNKKAAKTKAAPSAEAGTGKPGKLTPDMRVKIQKMIALGKSNEDIVEAFDGAVNLQQIYNQRYAAKKAKEQTAE